MRHYINLIENADFDFRHNDYARLDRFGNRQNTEFTDGGRADIPTRINDPRFADNAMSDGEEIDEEQLNEFQDQDQLDQLHAMLNQEAGLSDQVIRQSSGNLLTRSGLMKIGGRLGLAPPDVQALMNTLVQKLRDDRDDEQEAELNEFSLEEQYRRFVEDGSASRHFREAASGRYSYERDSLGSVTVRDDLTGNSKFYQGSEATNILNRLKQPGANTDAVLAPLVEFAELSHEDDAAKLDALTTPGGTYNFLWKIGSQHGTGTARFALVDDEPEIEVMDARDDRGNDIDLHAHYDELLQQARDFIPEA